MTEGEVGSIRPIQKTSMADRSRRRGASRLWGL
jgi:hypothetical protein